MRIQRSQRGAHFRFELDCPHGFSRMRMFSRMHWRWSVWVNVALVMLSLIVTQTCPVSAQEGLTASAKMLQEPSKLNSRVAHLCLEGRFSEAIPLAERALRIGEKVLGPDHPDVANSLNNLGLVWYSLHEYDRALSLYERALRILAKALGPDHPDVATSLSNLALLYQGRGEYERAIPFAEQALQIREKILRPDHPDVTESLDELVTLLYLRGEYDRATPLAERSLRIREPRLLQIPL